MITKKTRLFDLVSLILLTPLIVVLLAGVTQAVTSITDIKISFKMNPSITQGTYVGDRWISPPYYNVEEGKEITVEAVAKGLTAQGKLININAVWQSSNPAMITISPNKGVKVELTILKEGKSELKVTFEGISKKLPVKAWYKDNAIHVEISQPK